ncbi:protein CELLULOSE SYNTHASE INTERACTIVE 3-like isoform X2 [Capsicum chacoense]
MRTLRQQSKFLRFQTIQIPSTRLGRAEPPLKREVVSHSTSLEWKEGFTWAFDVPPKGQKLHILCKSKNTFGKTTG